MSVSAVEANKAADPPAKITIAVMARAALFEREGNVEGATKLVLYKLRNDAKLLRSVVEAAIEDAVGLHVQSGHRQQRASIIKQVTRDRVVALAEGMLPCLLDIPLAGGKRLRDANRTEVMEQVHRYEGQASNMMHKARWLTLIAQSLPEGKAVGDVMQESRVKELFEEAKNAN